MESEIQKWYANKNILVTGATGFMGKIMVEKLLRSCSNLSTIYMIVRMKKGKNIQQRFNDFVNHAIFDIIRDQPNGEAMFKKIKVLSGDLSLPNWNLSEPDLKLLQENVNVVFHMAANVRFDQDLKSAVEQNTIGTSRLLEIACSFKNLKAFVHVSTSYCHCDETVLEERFYPAPHDPIKVMDLVTWMEPDLIETLTPKLLKQSPNTYAYTKCLTEHLVNQYSDRLPVVITRPSIVTAVWKEPLPGWVGNLNGPTGLLVGAAKGVIRSMHCDPELKADVVPVDTAINCIIIVGYERGKIMEREQKMLNETPVYHITQNVDTPVSWGEVVEMSRKLMMANPFSIMLWYPGGSIKSSYLFHSLAVFFFHLIPAYLIDFLMVLTRNKPFLVQTQQRINVGLGVLQYYTTRPWQFHSEKMTNLYESLSDLDQDIFYTNRKTINHEQYLYSVMMGARKYVLHEEPSTIPYARRLMKKLYLLHLIVQAIFMSLFIWCFCKLSTAFLYKFQSPADLNNYVSGFIK